MAQELIIGLLFVAALAYLGGRAWKSLFRKKAGCDKGCGCATDVKSPSANKSGRLPV
ncbi:attachment p12 family protein [Larkinella arboricola]|uniref:Attachment p12 family protein n=1 Tax=Larkinella arboricola TaxID=643671 RepID=A0A327X172_LARAB|nr:FeoB-associated Cys-rich membrane protein [Larkinella arboricola]RAJ99971.1 attachment p12 family protein [Larkinella arboricola]